MKKLLCVVLALTAIFCFAGCENGKCDECGTDKLLKVYEGELYGVEGEYCPACYAEKVAEAAQD